MSLLKLESLRRLIGLPPGSAGSCATKPKPLIEVKFMRRDEDFVGECFGLGITGVLSLGLPDEPQGTLSPQL